MFEIHRQLSFLVLDMHQLHVLRYTFVNTENVFINCLNIKRMQIQVYCLNTSNPITIILKPVEVGVTENFKQNEKYSVCMWH